MTVSVHPLDIGVLVEISLVIFTNVVYCKEFNTVSIKRTRHVSSGIIKKRFHVHRNA
jgi:hypothetical protein